MSSCAVPRRSSETFSTNISRFCRKVSALTLTNCSAWRKYNTPWVKKVAQPVFVTTYQILTDFNFVSTDTTENMPVWELKKRRSGSEPCLWAIGPRKEFTFLLSVLKSLTPWDELLTVCGMSVISNICVLCFFDHKPNRGVCIVCRVGHSEGDDDQ